jgi:hypothetical protein
MTTIRNRSNQFLLTMGALLSLLVVWNATSQYLRWEQLRARFVSSGRPVPPAGPAETNLVLNGTAALALLGALGFIGWRTRYHRRAKRWEQQLAQGRAVQAQLMPAVGVEIPGVQLAAEFLPAFEVGGDLYDAFPTPDGRVAFSLGDVSGKGLPAALLMGMIQGAVRSNPWYRDGAAHEAFARQLNTLLCNRSAGAKFASLFWGVYDSARGNLSYVNAGHCPGFVIGRRGVQRLDSTGPVMGLLEQSQFAQASVDVRHGELLVLYSDGLVEGADARGEEYGEERLIAALQRCKGGSAEEARAEILHDYRAFLGAALPEDCWCWRLAGQRSRWRLRPSGVRDWCVVAASECLRRFH